MMATTNSTGEEVVGYNAANVGTGLLHYAGWNVDDVWQAGLRGWQVQADGSSGKSFEVDTGHDLSAAQHLRSDPVRRSAQPDRNDVHLADELHR